MVKKKCFQREKRCVYLNVHFALRFVAMVTVLFGEMPRMKRDATMARNSANCMDIRKL